MLELLVIEPDVAVERGFQFLARPGVVALQHLLDPAVEALDHAVGLWQLGRGQAVLDAKPGTKPVELVLASRGALAQAGQAVGERLAVIGQNGADADRPGPLQVAREPPGSRDGTCKQGPSRRHNSACYSPG